MARLPEPDRSTFPQDLQDFLATIPEHKNFNLMSYSISTIEPYIRQGVAQYTGLELPARTRELVILTTAAVAQAEYEFVQHVPISEAAGVDPEIREAVHRLEFDSPRLSAEDRAVVNFTAAVVRNPTVSDEVFDAVHAVLSNREILEAMQVIGFYWSFGRVATVLQVEIEPAHGTAVVEASRMLDPGPKIEPFPVHIPEHDLEDLQERLRRVRLPEAETVQDGTQGIGLDHLRSLLDAWRAHDWRSLEGRWDAIPHYRTRLDGLDIAFWHVRSPEAGAFPLVLTHGWPGSVLEFESVIGPLTDPVAHGGAAEDAFDVVIPALPGFGFSERPRERGWTPGRTARAWAELMTRLGYERFGAHGGDWGASVSSTLARLEPERVAALHLTMPFASPLPEDLATADEAEKLMIAKRDRFMRTGPTHAIVQSVFPQTLGYSLLDSPAGLAAWLGQALVDFSDTRPEAGGGVSLAQQVDNIALYWFTGTGASAARWYWEAARSTPRSAQAQNAETVPAPTAFTLFPGEPYPTARRWAEHRYQNIISWNEMEYGGHFAGWEKPGPLVSEIRNAFRQVRDRQG